MDFHGSDRPLATGIAGAVIRLVEFRIFSILLSGAPYSSLIPLLQIAAGLRLAIGLVGSVATIVALFGLTRPAGLG